MQPEATSDAVVRRILHVIIIIFSEAEAA